MLVRHSCLGENSSSFLPSSNWGPSGFPKPVCVFWLSLRREDTGLCLLADQPNQSKAPCPKVRLWLHHPNDTLCFRVPANVLSLSEKKFKLFGLGLRDRIHNFMTSSQDCSHVVQVPAQTNHLHFFSGISCSFVSVNAAVGLPLYPLLLLLLHLFSPTHNATDTFVEAEHWKVSLEASHPAPVARSCS